MKEIVIAIDGYSGTGKSSTAKTVASKLGYTYIDSGAMYRAVTLYFIENDIKPDDLTQVKNALDLIKIDFNYSKDKERYETKLNGKVVENEIRSMRITQQVSRISAIQEVRQVLVKKQRDIASRGGVVMDGRDVGSVVFPRAELKIFMTADVKIRAQRRLQELNQEGVMEDLETVEKNLKKRDLMDSTRDRSPLIKTKDAIEIDTTHLSFNQQVDRIVSLAKLKINQ
ncbi:MAG: (d)CMP kinase [Candidatus Cyclobacteriaceae bacterium M3_2C_046]